MSTTLRMDASQEDVTLEGVAEGSGGAVIAGYVKARRRKRDLFDIKGIGQKARKRLQTLWLMSWLRVGVMLRMAAVILTIGWNFEFLRRYIPWLEPAVQARPHAPMTRESGHLNSRE